MRMDEHIKRLIEKYTLEASRMSGEEAVERYKMAYTQATELGSAFTLRACAANLGAACIRLGKKKEAQEGLAYLKKAMPPEGVSDCVSNGDLYFNMGLGYEILGQYETAHSYLEQAWKDYQSERDNLPMKFGALKRLVQISKVRKRYTEAIRWCQQLEELYGQAQRPHDKMMIMQERASLQEKLEVKKFPETVEQCRHHVDQMLTQGKATVEILVVMSVMLTQCKEIADAHHYLQRANALLGVEHSMTVGKAVVLQNLGLLCNYLHDWEASLPYHRDAALIYQHYAALPPDSADSALPPLAALKCQGHCYINHGHALVKLDDVDEARIFFNKALELAKQSGDLDTIWQMDEALGAIHFQMACCDLDLPSSLSRVRMMQLNKSLKCYKLALMHLAGAPGGTSEAHDRVLQKYTKAKNLKDKASEGHPGEQPRQVQAAAAAAGDRGASTKRRGLRFAAGVMGGARRTNWKGPGAEDDEDSDALANKEKEEGSPVGQTMHSPGEEEDDQERMKALYKAQLSHNGNTLQGTEQVQTVTADVHRMSASLSEESGSIATSDDEDSIDDGDYDDKQEKQKRSPVGQTMHSPGEEEDDQERMKALYKAQLSHNGNTLQGTEQVQTVTADVHRMSASHSEESGSIATSDDEDSIDDGDYDDKQEKQKRSPVGQTMHSPGEEEDDQERMKALYKAQLSHNGNTLQGTEQVQTVTADVHRMSVSSSAESGSTTTGDDEDSTEEGEEEDKKEKQKRRQAPPVPTQSPPVTMEASGTYETPQTPTETEINELYGGASCSRPRPELQGTSNYANIDFDSNPPRSGTSSESDGNPDYQTVQVKPTPKPWPSSQRTKKQEEGPVNSLTHGQGKQTKESKTCVVM